jgi:hypothetical protein
VLDWLTDEAGESHTSSGADRLAREPRELVEAALRELGGERFDAVREQLHRTFEVGGQHGDLFAFSLKRRFGRQDLLGEMLGSVAVRRP